ncbi:MAG: pyridoxamine 5'-phosphate oxidase family protein [Phycisphaerales bacterium]
MLKAWWPSGPDDPSIAIIRVHVESAEYWDGPSNTLFTLQVIKSLVTGTPLADAMRVPASESPRSKHGSVII